LQQACELDEEALIDALEIAERAQLIGEVRPAGQETFAFAHGLTRTTLRESVSGMRRRRLHRRVATAIAALHPDDFATLAYHYEQAGDAERAQTYYTRASERALAVYANREAERYHHAALELSESDPDRAHLLSELGEALFRQSRYAEARQTWREAIDLYQAEDDHDNAARLYARAARAAWYAGDVPGGLALCRAGMAATPDQLETPGTAALVHETARAYYFNELPGEALPLCEQALAMAQRLGLAEVQADTLATLGVLPNQSFEAKLQALTRAVEIAESAGLLATAARAHYNLAGHLHERGDFIPTRDHYLRALELAQQMGIVSWEHDFLHKATGIALELGDLEVAEEELSTLQQLLNAIPDPDQAALHTSVAKASLLRRQGEWPEAIRLMQANLAEARRRDYHKLLTRINNTLGDTLLEVGQLDQAEQALVEARQILDDHDKCAEEGGVESSCLLSAVRIRQGRIEEARRLLNQARESIDPQSAPQNKGLIQWTEARLAAATRRWPEALVSFEGLARLLTELGTRWHLACILQEWAEVHVARGEPGDPARAQELLRDALAIFEQLPAPGYVALVEERLRATAHESVP
jgi:tetratricopeptide (TPR) repeat protein